MIKNNIKAILFASLIVAMILPFSGMNYAIAENDTSNHFERFLKLADKQQQIQQKLEIAEHNNNTKLMVESQNRIHGIQERMDNIQQEYINSIALTNEEIQELEEQGLKIFNELSNPDSSLYLGVVPDSYFVSQISKSTHLIFEGTNLSDTSISPNSALSIIQSNDNKGEFEGISYSIGNIQKASHFVSCPSRTIDCNYLMGGLAVDQSGELSTLTFWTKQNDGDLGFVMTAHGANAEGRIIEQYPHRNVGTVDTITSEAWGECDCAFVDAPIRANQSA